MTDQTAPATGLEMSADHCGADSNPTSLEREAGFTVRLDPGDRTRMVAERDLLPQPAGAA